MREFAIAGNMLYERDLVAGPVEWRNLFNWMPDQRHKEAIVLNVLWMIAQRKSSDDQRDPYYITLDCYPPAERAQIEGLLMAELGRRLVEGI